MVPAVKAVAVAGYRMMVPVHYIHASYVRSHFNNIEIGIRMRPGRARSCSRWSWARAAACMRGWAG